MASDDFAGFNRSLSRWSGRLAIIGTGKNAGKTSVLKHLLTLVAPQRIALTSIGRDGEPYDLLEMHAKPRLDLQPGLRLATAERCLAAHRDRFRFEETTTAMTPLGAVRIARVEVPCRVEVAGPSRIDELRDVAGRMQSLGSELVLIDGAFGRVAAGTADLAEAVIVVSGCAGMSRVEDAADTLDALLRGFQLPVMEPSSNGVTGILRRNSLTADSLNSLCGRSILLPSPAGCLLDAPGWRQLDGLGIRLYVERRPEILAVFVSGFRPHLPPLPAAELLETCRRRCPGLPLFDLALEGALQQ